MSMSINNTNTVKVMSNIYKIPMKRLLLILILSFSLLFFACGGDDGSSKRSYDSGTSSSDSTIAATDATVPDTDPSGEEGDDGIVSGEDYDAGTDTSDVDTPDPTEPDGTSTGLSGDEGDDGTSSGSDDPGTDTPDCGDTDPTEPDTNLSIEARIELLKNILFTAYSGMGDSDNCPLHNVMIKDLNKLAVTLALNVFQHQDLGNLFQNEDMMMTLEALMGTITNDELISRMELFMSNFQKENIVMTIEGLISNFREAIAAIQEHRFGDVYAIMQNSWELINIVDFDQLSTLLCNEALVNTIEESISTIATRLLSFNLDVEDLIYNIEDAVQTIRSQIIAGTMDSGLLNLFSNIMVQWMVEGKNTITYAGEGVTTTITMNGLASVVSGTGTEVTVTLSADFDGSGYTLGSSACTYTGNGDGSADLEAVIVINVSNTVPMIDVKSVEVTAHNTLHASYPTHDVQYEDWTVSYAVDCENLLNASLLSMIENLVQYPEDFKDNLEYMVKGVFSLNGNMYDISEMHFVKKEQNDGTSHLAINGSMLANLMGTDVSVDVASDTIKCDSDGVWYDSEMGITIDQNPVNILFDWNGSATIINETISFWQEILNPLN